eukprot:5316201-Pleurochrysis_carterae.AAC.1
MRLRRYVWLVAFHCVRSRGDMCAGARATQKLQSARARVTQKLQSARARNTSGTDRQWWTQDSPDAVRTQHLPSRYMPAHGASGDGGGGGGGGGEGGRGGDGGGGGGGDDGGGTPGDGGGA